MSTPTLIDALCIQRKQSQLANIPPTRLEINSPYGGKYSKFDLDMRRKAEVLKYANNASNTKTNNATKRGIFARLANLKQSPTANKAAAVINCPIDPSILTSTTASGVPGPPMLLYDDESVPLYKYVSNVDSYAQIQTTISDVFVITPNKNKRFVNDISGQAISMLYTRLADFGYLDTTYTVNIPIGISISGKVLSLAGGTTLTVSLTSAQLALYYNSGLIEAKTYSGTTLSMTLNLAGSSPNALFSVQNQYVGNVSFDGWRIYSAPGYVYQWYALMHLSYSGSASIDPTVSLNTVVCLDPNVQTTASGSVVVSSSTTGINGGTTIVTL
jgi:hypothetical protein